LIGLGKTWPTEGKIGAAASREVDDRTKGPPALLKGGQIENDVEKVERKTKTAWATQLQEVTKTFRMRNNPELTSGQKKRDA